MELKDLFKQEEINEQDYYTPDRIFENPKPFNFICGNRTAGKSFGVKTRLLKTYKKHSKITKYSKFLILFRYANEVTPTASHFFDDVLDLKFEKDNLIYKRLNDSEGEYYLNDELCGYSLCIKNFKRAKQNPKYQEVEYAIMDEFMPEDGKFLKDEIDMIYNIYQSCARGGGYRVRPNCYFIFISNTVTMINPYFNAFPEIKESFKVDTKYISRDYFQLELVYKQAAVDSLMKTGFGKAISDKSYGMYAMNNDFYLDNNKFIEKVKGNKQFNFTYQIAGKKFGVYTCVNKGIFYISNSFDQNGQLICVDNDEHDVNFLFVKQNEVYIKTLQNMYRKDCVRFEDLECKISFLTLTGLV